MPLRAAVLRANLALTGAVVIVARTEGGRNIFLSRKGAHALVKITDFGIAKAMPIFPDETRDTITGALLGAMSPLQCLPFTGDDLSLLRDAMMDVRFSSVAELFPETL